MSFRYLTAACVLGLSACAPISDETTSTITVNGEQYELRTGTVDGPNGSYQISRVKVRNKFYMCLPDSPGDCESAVNLARTEFDRD